MLHGGVVDGFTNCDDNSSGMLGAFGNGVVVLKIRGAVVEGLVKAGYVDVLCGEVVLDLMMFVS